jgi:hypothetical protein
MKKNELENLDYESLHYIKIANEDDQKRFLKKKRTTQDGIKNTLKKKDEIMREKLIEGIKTPLDRNNKGYKMLIGMGFKEGSSLGKNQQGIKEPISISNSLPFNKNILNLQISTEIDELQKFERSQISSISINKLLCLREKIVSKINTLMNIKENSKKIGGEIYNYKNANEVNYNHFINSDFEICFDEYFYENSFLYCELFFPLVSSEKTKVKLEKLQEFINTLDRKYILLQSYSKKNLKKKSYLVTLEEFFKAVSSILKRFSVENLNFCLTCVETLNEKNKIQHDQCYCEGISDDE